MTLGSKSKIRFFLKNLLRWVLSFVIYIWATCFLVVHTFSRINFSYNYKEREDRRYLGLTSLCIIFKTKQIKKNTLVFLPGWQVRGIFYSLDHFTHFLCLLFGWERVKGSIFSNFNIHSLYPKTKKHLTKYAQKISLSAMTWVYSATFSYNTENIFTKRVSIHNTVIYLLLKSLSFLFKCPKIVHWIATMQTVNTPKWHSLEV